MTTIISSHSTNYYPWFAKLFFVGLILQGLSSCSEQTRDPAGEGNVFPLQSIESLPLLGSTRPSLGNKTLLINFWATWCAPCREEMPYLQRLSERLDPDRFAVIGVSVDDDANLVREFLLQYRIRFPNYLDAGNNLASDRLGLGSYPQTFVVSPDGIIKRRIDQAIPADWNPFENATEVDSEERSGTPAIKIYG